MCITVYYCVLLCIAVYYCVLLCIAVYYCVLLCITVYCCVLLCIYCVFTVLLALLSLFISVEPDDTRLGDNLVWPVEGDSQQLGISEPDDGREVNGDSQPPPVVNSNQQSVVTTPQPTTRSTRPTLTKKEYSGHSSWHFISIFLFIAVLGVVGYFLLHNRKRVCI